MSINYYKRHKRALYTLQYSTADHFSQQGCKVKSRL